MAWAKVCGAGGGSPAACPGGIAGSGSARAFGAVCRRHTGLLEPPTVGSHAPAADPAPAGGCGAAGLAGAVGSPARVGTVVGAVAACDGAAAGRPHQHSYSAEGPTAKQQAHLLPDPLPPSGGCTDCTGCTADPGPSPHFSGDCYRWRCCFPVCDTRGRRAAPPAALPC